MGKTVEFVLWGLTFRVQVSRVEEDATIKWSLLDCNIICPPDADIILSNAWFTEDAWEEIFEKAMEVCKNE